MVDQNAIDTYIRYVRTRMQTINPTRAIRGPISADDWPLQKAEFGTLYLLVLGDATQDVHWGSRAIPVYTGTLQWTWMLLGTDIQQGTRQRNRGDRFREDIQIKAELAKAVYPYFTQKISLSVVNEALVATAVVPSEWVAWSALDFPAKSANRSSGVLYGVATEYLTSMLPQNTTF